MSFYGEEVVALVDGLNWPEMSLERQAVIVRSLIRGVQRWQQNTGLDVTVGNLVAEHMGYCHCCRAPVIFKATDPWLRDYYICTTCGSIPRERNIMRALDELIEAWPHKHIHESSPGNNNISKYCSNYSSSQFIEGMAYGAPLTQGGTCQNLECLTFPDNTFDVFVTQDVFEHVFDPAAACREIVRVLKPGGVHLFTTPRYQSLANTVRRAACVDGEVRHILEPLYHANPVGDGKALVVFDWGADFESLVDNWCGVRPETRDDGDRFRAIDGAYKEVFVMRKLADGPSR